MVWKWLFYSLGEAIFNGPDDAKVEFEGGSSMAISIRRAHLYMCGLYHKEDKFAVVICNLTAASPLTLVI